MQYLPTHQTTTHMLQYITKQHVTSQHSPFHHTTTETTKVASVFFYNCSGSGVAHAWGHNRWLLLPDVWCCCWQLFNVDDAGRIYVVVALSCLILLLTIALSVFSYCFRVIDGCYRESSVWCNVEICLLINCPIYSHHSNITAIKVLWIHNDNEQL